MGFFDNYPEFYKSGVNPFPNRLNERYKALIENNKPIISGKRILDIASDNGRWSFAAIKNDATNVLGVEILPTSVKFANELMLKYNVPKEKYRFIQGNIHETITQIEPNSIDTVFCFGYFYHTMHHMNLLLKIKKLNPKYIIFDTDISLIELPVIFIHTKGEVVTEDKIEGLPSKSAIEMMLKETGFKNLNYYNWPSKNLKNWHNLSDYNIGQRISFVAEREEN